MTPYYESVRALLTHRPYVVIGSRPIECCGNDAWRGHLCEYHMGWEDGIDAVLDHIDDDEHPMTP